MKKTNLLFLLSDNHARQGLGIASGGRVRTPHLDALARRGTWFASAYTASPICCPARASLACGRYPHETGYWDNAIVYDGRVPSWHHRLRAAGHRCAALGKLHFRSTEDDNGFSEEIVPMHILGGKGGVSMLLRWSGEEPVNVGQWEMYAEKSGPGSTSYQTYDAEITRRAVEWLEARADARSESPWALMVSYVSAHPPFSVPHRLLDLYEGVDVPTPPGLRPGERSEHPAVRHLRETFVYRDLDEAMVRRITRAYYALCTHLDEQIGTVLAALRRLGFADDTRIVYTSDHGEMLGAHGLLGKFNLFEGSAGVPMIMTGPDVPAGHVVEEPVSHIDLYPTILEAFGLPSSGEGHPPHARSLWPIMRGEARHDPVFAEYHAAGSAAGSWMVRSGNYKLIYHVGAPAQLFDLARDPGELCDLCGMEEGCAEAARLEARLREMCDPEEIDRRAKADQRAKAEFWGGNDAIRQEGLLVFTPAPGTDAQIEKVR
jgi:choline-sulfatase